MFAGFSLAAVMVGCGVAGLHGVPVRAWLINGAAWAVGAILAGLASRAGAKTLVVWLVIAVVGLAATFPSSGLNGVHRWIALGPIRLNGAELLLPATVVALAGLGGRSLAALLCIFVIMGLLALQPDASQAVAFAGAAVAVLVLSDRPRLQRGLAGLVIAVVASIACLRPDPLSPVPEVEGIIGLAAALSPLVAGLAMVILAGAVLAPLSILQGAFDKPVRAAACGLAAYLVLSAVAPVFGAFPVPLVGMGVSPILGAWLGFGALMGLARRSADLSADR